MASFPVFITFAVFLALLTCAAAQIKCNGLLDNPKVITTDVEVDGNSCTLQNVNVTGSVTVVNGGSLTTMGTVHIFGCVHAFKPQSCHLGGKLKVDGGVSVIDTLGSIFVGSQASVGTVSLTMVTNFVAHGNMTSLSVAESGSVSLFGAFVLGGGVFRRGCNGNTVICAANIEGGISFSAVEGKLEAVASSNCGQTFIDGTVSVNLGQGNVHIAGGALTAADVIVEEQKGDVTVMNADVSDVTINQLDGSVLLEMVVADSDATFSDVSNTVEVRGCRFDGDLSIVKNHAVKLHANDFGLEVVTVTGNEGPLVITSNTQFSISLTENHMIEFHDNKVRFAEISKNTGIINLNNNMAETISCSDNTPPPNGNGNTVSVAAVGQCSNIMKIEDPSLLS